MQSLRSIEVEKNVTIGTSPVNRSRNRFDNIIPCELVCSCVDFVASFSFGGAGSSDLVVRNLAMSRPAHFKYWWVV